MRKLALLLLLAALAGGGMALREAAEARSPENFAKTGIQAGAGTIVPPTHTLADDAAALDLKRQQLAERESAIAAKEEALKRLSANLEARIKQLEAAKRSLEASLGGKKKVDADKVKRTIKIYKALKPEEAGGLMNKLDEHLVLAMLDQMDQKTAVRLIPFLTQPRVLRWTRDNLAGR